MLKYNVEQVITPKALVYYHQRPDAKNDAGNSVHAGVREQERVITEIRNRYLRKDIQSGVFGIGYIMNHSEQESINLVRIEGHINTSNAQLGDRVIDRVHADVLKIAISRSIYEKVKRKITRNR